MRLRLIPPAFDPPEDGSTMSRIVALTLLLTVATNAASAQDVSSAAPSLDRALEVLTVLEAGQDLNHLAPIEQAVSRAQGDEQVRAQIESQLLAVLQVDRATDPASDYIGRQLAIVGSDAAVPVLAGLLSHPRRSYMARYALEAMGSPAAVAALRQQLRQVAGQPRVGIVISLGRLADAQSVPLLAKLSADADPALARAAIVALGRIGTAAAAEALQAVAPQAPASLQPALIDAQLAAAATLCRDGEHAVAARICESLQADPSPRVRAAALRGPLAARPAD
jgi:HEAT repeat protein